jgi:hypothetical protein
MCGSPQRAVVALGRREVAARLALPRRRGIQRQNGESHDLTLTAVFFLLDSGAQLGRRPDPYERVQPLIGFGISYARESWKSNVENVAPDPGTPRFSRGSARARKFFFPFAHE